MGDSQNQGYILGVPIIRIRVLWSLFGGPNIVGNYHANKERLFLR